MIPLGNIRRGVMRIADKASRLTAEHGQIAVFVGSNGESAALTHYDPDYTSALIRHSQRLAGVYRHGDDNAKQIAPMVREDLLCGMGVRG